MMTMAGLGQDGLNWGRVRHLRGRLYRWADPPPTHTTARTLTTGGGLQGQRKRQSKNIVTFLKFYASYMRFLERFCFLFRHLTKVRLLLWLLTQSPCFQSKHGCLRPSFFLLESLKLFIKML